VRMPNKSTTKRIVAIVLLLIAGVWIYNRI
jgi:hypothetical protein